MVWLSKGAVMNKLEARIAQMYHYPIAWLRGRFDWTRRDTIGRLWFLGNAIVYGITFHNSFLSFWFFVGVAFLYLGFRLFTWDVAEEDSDVLGRSDLILKSLRFYNILFVIFYGSMTLISGLLGNPTAAPLILGYLVRMATFFVPFEKITPAKRHVLVPLPVKN